jgi:hypothetical protein
MISCKQEEKTRVQNKDILTKVVEKSPRFTNMVFQKERRRLQINKHDMKKRRQKYQSSKIHIL